MLDRYHHYTKKIDKVHTLLLGNTPRTNAQQRRAQTQEKCATSIWASARGPYTSYIGLIWDTVRCQKIFWARLHCSWDFAQWRASSKEANKCSTFFRLSLVMVGSSTTSYNTSGSRRGSQFILIKMMMVGDVFVYIMPPMPPMPPIPPMPPMPPMPAPASAFSGISQMTAWNITWVRPHVKIMQKLLKITRR